MAYAALVSVSQTLEQIIDSEPYFFPCTKEKIVSFQETIASLIAFLDNCPPICTQTVNDLIRQIRESAYEAEDVLESLLATHFLHKYASGSSEKFKVFPRNLEKVMEDIVLMEKEAKKIHGDGNKAGGWRISTLADSSRPASGGYNTKMVALDSDLEMRLMDQLVGGRSKIDVVPIVGMGGIGKTTLARILFGSKLIKDTFDVCGWATISQTYNVRKIASDILKDIREHLDGGKGGEHDLYQTLYGRKYLIVLDDVWDTQAWYDMKRLLPENNNGSRVILTTRHTKVAAYANSSGRYHEMRLLNEDLSWCLLCQVIFPLQNCPTELVEIGKEISRQCQGLPLAISAIGGNLKKEKQTEEYWKYVSENPSRSNLMEEVAEECLRDFIERNLVFVHKSDKLGKPKECGIHDLFRDICVREARKEKFFLILHKDVLFDDTQIDSQRRLILSEDIMDDDDRESLVSSIVSRNGSDSSARSFICHDDNVFSPRITLASGLLKVWRIKMVTPLFPVEILELANLKYLELGSILEIPSIISRLRNLQTIMAQVDSMPPETWEMTRLRHLKTYSSHLPDIPDIQGEGANKYILKSMQTLSTILNFRCTQEVVARIPNLKSLRIVYYDDVGRSSQYVNNLVHLSKLESLHCEFDCQMNDHILRNLAFPFSLKQLVLMGCYIPWERMTIIGNLPELVVLKLKYGATKGKFWQTNEGEFEQLKFLLIQYSDIAKWKTEADHFPSLQHLILEDCHALKGLPSEIGEIPTLEVVELVLCSDAAESSARDMFGEDSDVELKICGFDSYVKTYKSNNSDFFRKDGKTKKKASSPAETELSISRLDIRVGLIVKAQKHHDADSLYVEEIDVGEPQPRTVVSGLVKYIPLEEMQNRKVCVLCNLKPAALRGIKSQAMVLAASNSDHTRVELVEPPPDAAVGERVTVQGFEGLPDAVLNPKKKVWETVQVDLKTSKELIACYKDLPLTTSSGVCRVSSISEGSIR